nr:uncharacterized protein LOC101949263 isoform X4 [Chrysemys picta bellii]
MIEICQALRNRLQRNQATAMDNLALSWMISGRNLEKQPMTLIDLCYGKTENLNLRYLSALEGKLSKLLKHLLAMRQTLSFILAPGQESCEKAHQILPTVVYARLLNHVTRCHQSLEECCSDLLVLTLIVPSAPWIHALQAELNFHRSMYNLQVKYTEAVFEGIKQAYHTFQENVVSVLCSPLQDVLSSYINLKAETSVVALRDFLTAFKNNAKQIQDTVDTYTPSKNQQHKGDEALSRFGKEFFLSLEHSLKDCGEQRDKAASEMETLQTELVLAFENLQSLRKERKEKKAESIPHFTKSEGGESAGGGAASGLDMISKDNPVPDSTPLLPPHSESLLPKHVSVMAEASSNSSAKLQQQSSKGLALHQKGKSSHRSKSMKTPLQGHLGKINHHFIFNIFFFKNGLS